MLVSKAAVVNVLARSRSEETLKKGRPEIFNTDQDSQFTGEAFTGLLESHHIRISMDGKGSYSGSLFIKRLWRAVKYEEVYLNAYQDGREARIGLGNYFRFHNTERPHQALGYRTPAEVFAPNSVEATSTVVLQSLTPDPLGTAGPNLGIAPVLSEFRGPPQREVLVCPQVADPECLGPWNLARGLPAERQDVGLDPLRAAECRLAGAWCPDVS